MKFNRMYLILLMIIFICFLQPFISLAQYTQIQHRSPEIGEIPVSSPGYYDKPGSVYLLVNDISAPKSALFLGKDVTLDLNGHTITYADAGYNHIPNGSFEEGTRDWDLTKAPSAKIEDKKVHVFIGDHILRLSKGEEIVSEFIDLPLPDRSYFAFCGVISLDMKVSVFVEDSNKNSITCITEYSDSSKVSCPVIARSPQLGGGIVYAHLNRLPAGKYRVRIKAETDCLIDYIDIRPAMDVGVGIVEKTDPMGHYDHLYNRAHSAFFDYTADIKNRIPVSGIPVVKGRGSVTIRNGIIKNGTPGILSWGIQSTGEDVIVVLDNVRVVSAGINSTAVDVPQAVITHSSFDVDNPFIINRHGSEFYAVDLRGEKPSEVSYSEFHGGQGCLAFKGDFSKVHHNFFANRQTVTNHYSIMAMGDSSFIFENLIVPEIGSGIEIYVHRGIEIFNNDIKISASPPTCEYGHEEYSTTAIRIADYNAKPGAPGGCFGNKVYNNKISVTGFDYPEYKDYIPMAWAVFYSSSAGDNYIFNNEIVVHDKTPGLKNETSAFYIGGGAIGGQFNDNRITSDVPVAWIASPYGAAKDTRIFRNTIVKAEDAGADFKPFRMGWKGWEGSVAENIRFESNNITGAGFGIDATDQIHSYSVCWTLSVKVVDKAGNVIHNAPLRILDKNGTEVVNTITPADGIIHAELPEYSFKTPETIYKSPYKVIAGKKTVEVKLDKDLEITILNK
jgi:hypothetical protein